MTPAELATRLRERAARLEASPASFGPLGHIDESMALLRWAAEVAETLPSVAATGSFMRAELVERLLASLERALAGGKDAEP